MSTAQTERFVDVELPYVHGERLGSCSSEVVRRDSTTCAYFSGQLTVKMSIRVVARIRPLLKAEIEKDVIVTAAGDSEERKIVRIPNPKNEAELYSFQFSNVYDQTATQANIFENEGQISTSNLISRQ